MESTRNRLIKAAVQLLDEGGPAAVTLREVGRRAGVSHNAPYKHFADKEDLLAAVAARELSRQGRAGLPRGRTETSPIGVLHEMMQGYIRWAMCHPARFKLTFGSWTTGSAESTGLAELGTAATAARSTLVAAVRSAQAVKALPAGDAERVAALILAVTHGAVDLALSGHLSRTGKGNADPIDLVNDLLDHLRQRETPVPQTELPKWKS